MQTWMFRRRRRRSRRLSVVGRHRPVLVVYDAKMRIIVHAIVIMCYANAPKCTTENT